MDMFYDDNIWKEWKFLTQKISYSKIIKDNNGDSNENISNEEIDFDEDILSEDQEICKKNNIVFRGL